MTADVAAAMDGLATACASLADNVYPWPADSVSVPCVVVGYPTTIDFDSTMARGADELVIPVWYVVGKTSTKDARDRLSTIIPTMKNALDGAYAFGDVRATTAGIAEMTVSATTYLAVRFDCEVIG
jgi:hypothetical protein